MLYCVNMASYRAISPLWPAAAQARASRTGIAYRNKEQLSCSDRLVGSNQHSKKSGTVAKHSPYLLADFGLNEVLASHSEKARSHDAVAVFQKLQHHW